MAGRDNPDIYAHASFMNEQLGANPVRAAIVSRSLRQFGVELSPADRPNLGVGPALRLDWTGKDTFLQPTRPVDDRLDVVVAGVRLSLVHAPGENPDEMYVLLPDKSVLLSGDNYYHAFPNLSPIRGSSYRDPRLSAASLTRIIGEGAEFLVPSHTRPIIGKEVVRRRLTGYRDAITSVWEQTIDGINRGLTPDQLVDTVKLPEELAAPHLQQFYGTVAWAVRSIYAGNLGWFNGNPTELFPLSAAERARRTIDLVGGEAKLLSVARAALENGDVQWGLELVDHLLAIDANHQQARSLKASALETLARRQTSANARNYYLSVAKQLRSAPK
jgi:alkyl sulfatase BDS1-like metallo-beta-lactamase superfamily hydrolase